MSDVGGFDGTFSSKLIGNVFDFFTGSIGLPGGALGGFFGVASNMGGEKGPLEFGDRVPLEDGESAPFRGICRESWFIPLMAGATLLACGMIYADHLRFLLKRKFPR